MHVVPIKHFFKEEEMFPQYYMHSDLVYHYSVSSEGKGLTFIDWAV